MSEPEKLSPETVDFFARKLVSAYEKDFERMLTQEEEFHCKIERGSRLAKQWNLADTLRNDGVLVFPHVYLGDCCHLASAVVDACLSTGTDRILVVSLMHAFSTDLMNAFIRVAQGGDAEKEPLRGIYGPGLPRKPEADTWEWDHVLFLFRKLIAIEAKRRNIKAPTITERFVFLSGPNPETLNGFDELKELAKDAVVVSSADHAHHGIGYNTPPQDVYPMDEEGLLRVREQIMDGLRLLDAGRYDEYQRHCFNVTRSDWESAGVVVNALKGPLKSSLHGMGGSDYSDLFHEPRPTWAASVLLKQDKV